MVLVSTQLHVFNLAMMKINRLSAKLVCQKYTQPRDPNGEWFKGEGYKGALGNLREVWGV